MMMVWFPGSSAGLGGLPNSGSNSPNSNKFSLRGRGRGARSQYVDVVGESLLSLSLFTLPVRSISPRISHVLSDADHSFGGSNIL